MNPNDHNAHDNAPDGHEIVRRTDYDGSQPIEDPASEAIANFFAAPRQLKQFKSAIALAEHFGISRMTVYRRAKDGDVIRRIKWILRESMFVGDLIAAREWRGIVEGQVRSALAGDTRAATFCMNRAWRQQRSIFGDMTTEPAIGGADAITLWHENADEQSEAEELKAKENPETKGENPTE